MVSATSNLLGMYPGVADDAGYSYPNITEWPHGYVPIAIHTINQFYDYTLNPNRECKRLNEIMNLIEETPEYKSNNDKKKDFLGKLNGIVGINIALSNISKIADILHSETIWNKTMAAEIDTETLEEIKTLSNLVESWKNGL
uniref:Uncharacterized protein n=1 Tax=Panagrolaimus sp. PS1159 TaxID=55785 RepID=A0AC35EVJ3_9BILA